MRLIPLTQGKFAIVDDEDYEYLSQFKWYAGKSRKTYYAQRGAWIDGELKTVKMHHVIMGKKPGFVVDHINGNGLDNRRENLRLVTPRQNLQNRHITRTSQYPGVCWRKDTRKWNAWIRIGKRNVNLGSFNDEYQAFLAYKYAVEQLGEKVI